MIIKCFSFQIYAPLQPQCIFFVVLDVDLWNCFHTFEFWPFWGGAWLGQTNLSIFLCFLNQNAKNLANLLHMMMFSSCDNLWRNQGFLTQILSIENLGELILLSKKGIDGIVWNFTHFWKLERVETQRIRAFQELSKLHSLICVNQEQSRCNFVISPEGNAWHSTHFGGYFKAQPLSWPETTLEQIEDRKSTRLNSSH